MVHIPSPTNYQGFVFFFDTNDYLSMSMMNHPFIIRHARPENYTKVNGQFERDIIYSMFLLAISFFLASW